MYCAFANPFGGLAIPVDRFGVVLGDAFAVVVHQTEVELHIRIPLLGKRLPKPKGFLVIARVGSGHPILKIPRPHRRGEQHECGQSGEEGAHRLVLLERHDVLFSVTGASS